MTRLFTIILAVCLTAAIAAAQTPAEIWKSFAEQMDLGTELTVRLNDGRQFKATLVGTSDTAMLVQHKTRGPVPIQAVPYDDITRIERTRQGVGPAKAVAIGVATGVGTFFGILVLMIGMVSD